MVGGFSLVLRPPNSSRLILRLRRCKSRRLLLPQRHLPCLIQSRTSRYRSVGSRFEAQHGPAPQSIGRECVDCFHRGLRFGHADGRWVGFAAMGKPDVRPIGPDTVHYQRQALQNLLDPCSRQQRWFAARTSARTSATPFLKVQAVRGLGASVQFPPAPSQSLAESAEVRKA